MLPENVLGNDSRSIILESRYTVKRLNKIDTA
jgi:hypothetical protein